MQDCVPKLKVMPRSLVQQRKTLFALLVTCAMMNILCLQPLFAQEYGAEQGAENIFDIVEKLYANLEEWSAPNIPQKKPQRYNLKESEKTIEAFFSFLSQETFHPIPEQNNPDRDYLHWLHTILPKQGVTISELKVPISNYIVRRLLLERIRDVVLKVEKKAGVAESTQSDDTDIETMDWTGRIRTALDFQTWYASNKREWRYNGIYRRDANAGDRDSALRFCSDNEYENLRDVRTLRDLLGLLGADDFFDEDIRRRPWLIVGSFCEFFSLERFNLSENDLEPDVKSLFPYRQVLQRKEFSVTKFSMGAPLLAAENLSKEQSVVDPEGLLFKDIMAELEAYYTSPRHYRWELQRVGNPEPGTPKADYKKMLESILAELER